AGTENAGSGRMTLLFDQNLSPNQMTFDGLPPRCDSRLCFHRHRVSRTRRTQMGVRIVLADKEPIGLALRRFKTLLERHGATWELRRRRYFIKPTQSRRAKRFQKRFK